jgi:NAD(P)-dependent dehydrogenase (short-subunit alcohol dehydrogenase family)
MMNRGHALVTGALGGLGTAITANLLSAGHSVVACDRRGDDADSWLAQFPTEQRDRLSFHALDIRNLGACEKLRDQLIAESIHIAYLINNAGIANLAPPWEMDPAAFDRVIQVNVYGTFHLTRTFCGAMRERNFGRVVNFASLAAFDPDSGMAGYAAAKAGVIGYTHSIAGDLAAHNITANAIAPGLIWHERLRPTYTDEEREKFRRNIPMAREGEPAEIAETVAFLLSDGAAYITGQTIHVNGGAYMT